MGGKFAPVKDAMMLAKSLLSEPKHTIIEALAEGDKSSGEIYEILSSNGYEMPKTTFYYHLSALEDMGIIEMAGYKEPDAGAIPEKVWHLKVRKICLDIVSGTVKKE